MKVALCEKHYQHLNEPAELTLEPFNEKCIWCTNKATHYATVSEQELQDNEPIKTNKH
jgi:hypothetical protein